MVVAVGLAVENDLLALWVHRGDLSQQHLHVVLLAHQFAQRRGHITSRDQTCGYLIKQGLEQVEVALVNQGDAHIGLGQGLAGVHPCKATTHDHHMRCMA